MRRKSDTSMHTLAARLGVSPATVSRALNNSPLISEPTRNRIIAEARAMKLLRNRKSVAVLIPKLWQNMTPLTFNYMKYLFIEAEKRHWQIEYIHANHLNMLNERIIDGIISLDYTLDLGRRFSKTYALPIVCINEYADRMADSMSVVSDERENMRELVSWLAGKGHSGIGLFFAGPPDNYITKIRLETFMEQTRTLGVAGFEGSESGKDGNSDYEKSFAELYSKKITALICCGEKCIEKIYPFFRKMKISVPRQLEVAAWYFSGTRCFLNDKINIVEQNYPLLAKYAFELLERKLDGEKEIENKLVKYRFFPRDGMER